MSDPAALAPEKVVPAGARAASPGAFFYMDAMRAVLALVVAFGHIWALLIRDYRPADDLIAEACYFVAGFGHQAVILFFVLSGFWITRSVVRHAERGWSWCGYLIERLSRLAIVLVPTLILGGSLDAIGVFGLQSPTHLGQTDTYVLRKDVVLALSPTALLGNLAFLQIFVPPFGTNGPLWSVSYEFWFYIWFPALWLLFRQRRLSIGLLTLAFGWFVPTLALAFLCWLCGSALYGLTRVWRHPPWLTPMTKWGLLVVTGAGLALFLVFARFGEDTWKDPALALVFALFLLALIAADPKPLKLLRPVAIYGSNASFSLYAIHFPVMALVTALVINADRLEPTSQAIGGVAAIMISTVNLAWVFSRQTEARTPQLRAYLHRRLSTPARSS